MAKRKSSKADKRVKTAFSLSDEAIRKLGAAVAFKQRSQSDLVEGLILREFNYRVVVEKPVSQVVSSMVSESVLQGHQVSSEAVCVQ